MFLTRSFLQVETELFIFDMRLAHFQSHGGMERKWLFYLKRIAYTLGQIIE